MRKKRWIVHNEHNVKKLNNAHWTLDSTAWLIHVVFAKCESIHLNTWWRDRRDKQELRRVANTSIHVSLKISPNGLGVTLAVTCHPESLCPEHSKTSPLRSTHLWKQQGSEESACDPRKETRESLRGNANTTHSNCNGNSCLICQLVWSCKLCAQFFCSVQQWSRCKRHRCDDEHRSHRKNIPNESLKRLM